MSSFHHRSQYDVKRKIHKTKGKSIASSANKIEGRVEKKNITPVRRFQHASQWRDVGKAQRHATQNEKRKKHREETIKKRLRYYGNIKGGLPKIIAIVPLSKHAKPHKIKQAMIRHCNSSLNINEMEDKQEEGVVPVTCQIGNKISNFLIWTCKRNKWSILDISKVADIVLLIGTPTKELIENPINKNYKLKNNKNNKKTLQELYLGIDKLSFEYCKLIKSQGVNNILGLYQPMFHKLSTKLTTGNSKIQCKVDTKVVSHFKNFVEFNFGKNNNILKSFRVLFGYDMVQLFRFLDQFDYNEIEWKQKRNYLLGEKLKFHKYGRHHKHGRLVVTGFLRGKRPFDINKPIHITGVGDFLVSKIEGIPMQKPKKVPILPSVKRSLKKQQNKLKSQKQLLNKKNQKRNILNNSLLDDYNNSNNNNNNNKNNDNDINMNENSNNKNTFISDEHKIDLDNLDNNNNDKYMNNNNLVEEIEYDFSFDNNNTNNTNNNIKIDNTEYQDVKMNDSSIIFEDVDESGGSIMNDKNNTTKKNNNNINLPLRWDENDPIVLAIGDEKFQSDLKMLRDLDELGTENDQSIITEEELKEADKRRREAYEKEKQNIFNKKNRMADHLTVWEEALGWNNNNDDNNSDNDNDNDSDNDAYMFIKDDKFNKKKKNDFEELKEIESGLTSINLDSEMNDPIEVMAKKKELEKDEFDFPDEVETPVNEKAKKKFAQYRGLNSLAKTKWDKFEELPLEYSRIYSITDWKLAYKNSKINDKLLDNNMLEGIKTGRRVRLTIEKVPISASKLWDDMSDTPTIIWGLLEYEHKISVCHYLVKKNSEYSDPVQGLQSYIFDIGFRRFKSRPIFSQNSNILNHLVQKFLNDKEYCIASVYAPITYPPMPVLLFEDPQANYAKTRRYILEQKQENDNEIKIDIQNDNNNNELDPLDIYDFDNKDTKKLLDLDLKNAHLYKLNVLIGNKALLNYPCDLVASGNFKEVNAHRLLIRRKILTGRAVKVHRRRAIVRHMFYDKEDVEYFKPIELWTKKGLLGRIEESLGEKGYMKCFFNDTIQQNDTVCLSLYKRLYPVPDPSIFTHLQ